MFVGIIVLVDIQLNTIVVNQDKSTNKINTETIEG